jgi:hypothetical protein
MSLKARAEDNDFGYERPQTFHNGFNLENFGHSALDSHKS